MDYKISNMGISSVFQRMLEILSKSDSITFEECHCYVDLFAYHYLQSLKVDLANCELSRRIFQLECSFSLKTFNSIEHKIRSNQTWKFNGIHLTLVECVSVLIALNKLVTRIENEDDISSDIKAKFLNNMGQLSKNLKQLVAFYPVLSDSVQHVLNHAKLMFETCINSDDLKRFMSVIYGDFEFSCDCINANQFKLALASLLNLNETLPQPRFLNCTRLCNENSFEYLSDLVLKILSLINSGDSTRSERLERKFKNDEEIQRLFGNDLEDSVTLIAPDSERDSDSNVYALPSLPQINIASLPIVSTIIDIDSTRDSVRSGSKLKNNTIKPSSENSDVDICGNSNETQIKRVLSEDSESFQEEILESEPEENITSNEPEIAQDDEIPVVDLSNGSSSIDNSKKITLHKTDGNERIFSPRQSLKTVLNDINPEREDERTRSLQNRILIPTKNGIPNKLDDERARVLSNQNLSASNDEAAQLSQEDDLKENSFMKATQLRLSDFSTQMPSTSAENHNNTDGTNEKVFTSKEGVSKSTPGRSSKPHARPLLVTNTHSSESDNSLIYVRSHTPSTFPLGGVRKYDEGSDDSCSRDFRSKTNPRPSYSSANSDSVVPYGEIPQYEEELSLDSLEITGNNPVLGVESELPKRSSGTSMREQTPYNSSHSSEASRIENQNKQPGISGNRANDNNNPCLIADVIVKDRFVSRGTEVNPDDFGLKSASSKPKKNITNSTEIEKITTSETIIVCYEAVSLESEDISNKEMEEIVNFLEQIETVGTLDRNVVPRSNNNEVEVGSSISLVKDVRNPIKRESQSETVISSHKNQTVKKIKQEPEEDIDNSAKSVEIVPAITKSRVSSDETLPRIRANDNSEVLKTVVKLETVSDDEIEKRTLDLREKTIDEGKKLLEITKRELESSMEMDDSLDQTLIPEIVCTTPRTSRLSRTRRRTKDASVSSKSCDTPLDSSGINSATPIVVNTPSSPSTPNSKNNGEQSLLNSSSSSLGSPGYRRRLFNPKGNPILMETPATDDVPLNDVKKIYEPIIPNLPNNATKPSKPLKTVRKGDSTANNDLKIRPETKKTRKPQYRLPILSSDDEEEGSQSRPPSQSANDSSKSRNQPPSKPASNEMSSNLRTASKVNVAVPEPGSDPNEWTDSDIVSSGAIPFNDKSVGNNAIESRNVDPSNGKNSQRNSKFHFSDSEDSDDAILSSPRRNIPVTTTASNDADFSSTAKNKKRKIKLKISSSESSSSDESLSQELFRKKLVQTPSRLSRKRSNAMKINEPPITNSTNKQPNAMKINEPQTNNKRNAIDGNKPQISDKPAIKSNKPPKSVKIIPVVKLSRLEDSSISDISVEMINSPTSDRSDASSSKVVILDHRKSETKSPKLNQKGSSAQKTSNSGHDNATRRDNCNDIDRQTYNLEVNNDSESSDEFSFHNKRKTKLTKSNTSSGKNATNNSDLEANNDSESSDEFSFHNKRKTKFTKSNTSSGKNATSNSDKINSLAANIKPILRVQRLNPANMFKQPSKEDDVRRVEPIINSETNKIVETTSNNSEKLRKPKKMRRIIINTSESDSDTNSENTPPIDSENTDYSSDETLPINRTLYVLSSDNEDSSNFKENEIIHQEKTTAKRGAPTDFDDAKNDKRFASSLPSSKERCKTIASNADQSLPKSGLRSEPSNVDKVLPSHNSLVKHSNPLAKLVTNDHESLPTHRSQIKHPKSLDSDVDESHPKRDSSKEPSKVDEPRHNQNSKSIASNVDEAVAKRGLTENVKTNQIRPSTSKGSDASTSSGRNLNSSSSRQTENQPSTSKVDDNSKAEPSSKWLTKKETKYDPKATNVLRRKPWSFEEEELLYIGVQKYGVGHWYHIATKYGIQRSSQQLYDKWRNLSFGNNMLKVELRVKEGRKKPPVVKKAPVVKKTKA